MLFVRNNMEFVATDNTQLDALANQDPYLKKVYEVSFPCDLLPRSPNKAKPTAYIVNTDPAGQPGQHWIALWTQNNVCEVMDSYGLPLEWYRTTRPIIDWITSHWKHWVTNGTTLQGLHSYACGRYCITYLKMKARGGSLQDFLALFSEQQTCQMREKVIKSVGW